MGHINKQYGDVRHVWDDCAARVGDVFGTCGTTISHVPNNCESASVAPCNWHDENHIIGLF